jgi:hypothetical protein
MDILYECYEDVRSLWQWDSQCCQGWATLLCMFIFSSVPLPNRQRRHLFPLHFFLKSMISIYLVDCEMDLSSLFLMWLRYWFSLLVHFTGKRWSTSFSNGWNWSDTDVEGWGVSSIYPTSGEFGSIVSFYCWCLCGIDDGPGMSLPWWVNGNIKMLTLIGTMLLFNKGRTWSQVYSILEVGN